MTEPWYPSEPPMLADLGKCLVELTQIVTQFGTWVEFKPSRHEGVLGRCHLMGPGHIEIDPSYGLVQMVHTLSHEVGHAFMHTTAGEYERHIKDYYNSDSYVVFMTEPEPRFPEADEREARAFAWAYSMARGIPKYQTYQEMVVTGLVRSTLQARFSIDVDELKVLARIHRVNYSER